MDYGASGPGLVARGLRKSYGSREAVGGIDLEVEAGSTFALLGPNGAGKTTTVKMLACLLKPSGGQAWVLGRDVDRETREAKALIGVSPQETAVATRLTVVENLLLIGGCYGMGRRESRRRAEELLAALSLEDRAHDRVASLSGGMERRLSIAMAMVADPPALFLDEPTLGLDPDARRELWTLLESFSGRKTILLTTHYLEEAERLASRIAVMSGGRIVATGSADGIKAMAPGGDGSLEDAYLALVRKVVEA